MIEKVNVDSHRINIPELTEKDTSGDLTGGYLMEIDERQGEAYNFITPHAVAIGLNDPDFSPDPEVPAQTAYITQYVDTAENALFSSEYTDPKQGWRAYFDEASLVNFYIVNDVMGNVDGGAFFSSDYLYKTVDNPLLYMGPIWDFDISAGNVNYQPIVSPTVPWMQVEASWYKQLFTDPTFTADVQTQWNTLKNNAVFTNWVSSIQQQSTVLTQSAQNNFTRWPMVGETVWPNPSAQATDWVNQRIGYLDAVLNGQAQSAVQIGSGPVAATKGRLGDLRDPCDRHSWHSNRHGQAVVVWQPCRHGDDGCSRKCNHHSNSPSNWQSEPPVGLQWGPALRDRPGEHPNRDLEHRKCTSADAPAPILTGASPTYAFE